jgi:hypothetical protein
MKGRSVRISRRTFLAIAAVACPGNGRAAPGAAWFPDGRSAGQAVDAGHAIRILAAIEGAREDVRAGIEFGEREARQTLGLLGKTLDLVWATAEQLPNVREMLASARVVGYTAAIVALDDPPPAPAWNSAGLPVLALTPISGAETPAPSESQTSVGGLSAPPSTTAAPGTDAAPTNPVGAGVPPSQGDATRPPPPPSGDTPAPSTVPGRWLFSVRAEGGRREWGPDLERFGAGELNERFRGQTGRPMTADAWCGWVAMKAIAEAALHARSTAPADVADALRVLRFDGHKGEPLYFDDRLRLVQPVYD